MKVRSRGILVIYVLGLLLIALFLLDLRLGSLSIGLGEILGHTTGRTIRDDGPWAVAKDVMHGEIEGKRVIPYHLDMLREFWAGSPPTTLTP